SVNRLVLTEVRQDGSAGPYRLVQSAVHHHGRLDSGNIHRGRRHRGLRLEECKSELDGNHLLQDVVRRPGVDVDHAFSSRAEYTGMASPLAGESLRIQGLGTVLPNA